MTEQMKTPESYEAYVSGGLSKKTTIFRNILLINDANQDKILTEGAPVSVDDNDNVFFKDLIIYLREQNLIAQGSSLFFYDIERSVFVHQGKEPVTTATLIPLKKFSNEEIIIKYRPPVITDIRSMGGNGYAMNSFLQNQQSFLNNNNKFNPGRKFEQQQQQYLLNRQQQQQQQFSSVQEACSQSTNDTEENYNSEVKAIPREKRVKERKIGYVYERVQEWRRFYETGVMSEGGRLQKVNLDVAASLVGLSRKTLDDYYKYIRKAEQFNFDFKARSEEKIGVLRNFVRDRQRRDNGKIEEVEEFNEDENKSNDEEEEEKLMNIKEQDENNKNNNNCAPKEESSSKRNSLISNGNTSSNFRTKLPSDKKEDITKSIESSGMDIEQQNNYPIAQLQSSLSQFVSSNNLDINTAQPPHLFRQNSDTISFPLGRCSVENFFTKQEFFDSNESFQYYNYSSSYYSYNGALPSFHGMPEEEFNFLAEENQADVRKQDD